MKAVRIHKHGGVDMLKWEDIPTPQAGPGQIQVEVKATSLNHLDLWVREGIPGVPFPLVTGSDAAGIVSAVGKGVDTNRIGEKVMIQPLIYCNQCSVCQSGNENFCEGLGILGETQQGVNAEKIVVDQFQAVPFPSFLDFEQAAAFGLVAQTSYQMLVNRAELLADELVLLWGAGSGVGSMGIQIAKAMGARVIAISGSDEKLTNAKGLGADYVLNYNNDDMLSQVSEISKGKGVDVVFEHVGQVTWEISMRSLGHGGRLVTCGATTGNKAHINLTHLFFKQQSILGSTMGTRSAFDGAMTLLNEEKIKPVVDKVFPMATIADAHKYLETGSQFGKVVLKND
ncbi:uncharacterized protein METZ01_LOCUS79772 [marine metagenome]|uniref:Enoyl reductase (ER) domain-containing protein n=1 Tax=marine metagenome TaxID=408172 RepID=A0A381UGY7_9ZZZZ